MDVTHYLFAFFVFVLVCAAIWLFGRVMRGGKKDDTNAYEKEQRLFKLYQNVEDMMNGFEEYVDETKKELDERVAQLQQEAQTAHVQKGVPSNVSVLPGGKAPRTIAKDGVVVSVSAQADEAAADALSDIPDSVKQLPTDQAIAQLLERGLRSEQIAKYLGISNREVTLIMGIKKMGASGNIR